MSLRLHNAYIQFTLRRYEILVLGISLLNYNESKPNKQCTLYKNYQFLYTECITLLSTQDSNNDIICYTVKDLR